jgi:F-type H+-transporting ATPase subunit a
MSFQEVNLEHSAPTTWLLKLPFLPHDPHFEHVNGAVLVTVGIVIFAFLANLAIKNKIEANLVPKPKGSFLNAVDVLIESLHNMVVDTLGHHGEKYFPMIAAIFIFVLSCNLLGLLPHGGAPTSNTSTTFGLGLAVFLYYNFMGLKEHGPVGYVKHFLMGLGIAGIPIAVLELVSHAIRPISLGVRLYVNMFVDHAVVSNFGAVVAYILPVPLLLFGIVVSTIQAFVFAMLTAVYVQMATEHDH